MPIESLIFIALLALWAAWALQGVVASWQVVWFAARINARRGRYGDYQPRAFVIVPFKGLERDLPGAIDSLCRQSYRDYRLLLVVESQEDPACAPLQRELARHPRQAARLIIAGVAPGHQGQKLHNQLAVLRAIDAESRDEDVWVFADSDAVPGPDWLAELVGPLCRRDKYGVSTGYRWLTPAPDDHGRVTLWSHLASVMNSSVACLLGRPRLNFAWGGSMAVRVDTARRGHLIDRWTGALTDDYPLSRLCRDLKLKVAFAPACLVATPAAFTFASLLNFGHRQYLLTRVYVPWLYGAAAAFTGLYVAGLVTSVAWMAAAVLTGCYTFAVPVLATWAVRLVSGGVRATYRRKAVADAFGPEAALSLRTTLRIDRWLTPLWMTLHFLLIVRAGIGRTMVWRGKRYRLRGPNDIEQF